MEINKSKSWLLISALLLSTELSTIYGTINTKQNIRHDYSENKFSKNNPNVDISINFTLKKYSSHICDIIFFKNLTLVHISSTNLTLNNHFFKYSRVKRKIENGNELWTTKKKTIISDKIYINKKTTNIYNASNDSSRSPLVKSQSLIVRSNVMFKNISDLRMERFKEMYQTKLWKEKGWFDDDYLPLINVHWLSFEPPQDYVQYSLGFAYILLMLFGCSGNAIVLLMFLRCRSLRTPANILVANLAISDFLMMSKTPIFIYNSFYLGPALGKIGCIFYGFLGGLTGTVDITTLSAIAFDRYSVVVNPLEPLKSLNNVRAKLLVVSTWIYGCVFAIVPALDFGYGRYSPEGYLTSCSFDYLLTDPKPRIFIFVFFVAAWLLPFIIISFCYIRILAVVMTTASISQVAEQTLSTRHIKEQVKRKAELKLSALVIVVIALFFVSWTPYALVSLVAIFGRPDLVTPIVSMVPALFCKTASCINPFIYIMTHPKFRKEFEQIFHRRKGALRKQSVARSGWSEGNKDKPEREPTSDDDIEIIEIRNIPFANTDNYEHFTQLPLLPIRAVSSHLHTLPSCPQGTDGPPSWFVQPQFSKQNSFKKSFY